MKKILKVPFLRQSFRYSCFPVSIKMVLNFYGDNVSEKILYKSSMLPGHNGCWDTPIAKFLLKKGYKVTSFWNGIIEGWTTNKELIKSYKREYKAALKKGMKHKRNANVSLIRKFVDEGIPVLTEVNADKFYNKKLNYTHMIVVVGYDDKNFYVHDPHKKFGSKLKKIPISQFKKSWERLSKNAGRSMFVIEPK